MKFLLIFILCFVIPLLLSIIVVKLFSIIEDLEDLNEKTFEERWYDCE